MIKKAFFLLVIGISGLTVLNAQNFGYEVFDQSAKYAQQKIQQFIGSQTELDEFTLCQTFYQWDSITNQPFKSGDGTMSYEEQGDIKKFTIITETTEDGEVSDIKIEAFFSFQDLALNDRGINGDSILIYTGDGSGQYILVFKDINYWEDEKMIRKESYTDFGLFDPSLDFMLSGVTRYKYDGEGYLVEEVGESFNIFSGELTFSDSIVYQNNELGLPVVETGFEANIFTGMISASYQTTYSYINDFYVDVEVDHVPAGNLWIPTSRYDTEYDTDNRPTQMLIQNSETAGLTWENSERDQYEYELSLPLDFFTKQLNQSFVDNAWRNEALTVNEDCTSGINELFQSKLVSWFEGDRLQFETELQGPVQIELYNLAGQRLYESGFKTMPSGIFLSGLERGIYILRLSQPGTEAVVKVFK
jgi:hypothetical protein